MQLAMIEDNILAMEKLESPWLDRGLYFGDGVYEVVRSYNGRIFALDEHLERLNHSLAAIGIKGVDIEQIRNRVQKAFETANIANARIYFHITRGSMAREHTWPKDLKPNFFLTVTELPDDSKLKTNGVAVSTHPDWRWKRCDIKSLNLLPNILAKQNAAGRGCFEAILVDEAGFITEGSSSAFFAIFGNTLRTSPLGKNILPSITRKYVIEAAVAIELTVVEKSMRPEEARTADEVFLAVTTKDIVPVVKFDDQVIGGGRSGNYTKMLIREFRRFTG